MTVALGDSIQRYPLLRLLVSYICGIGLADVLYPRIPELSLYGVWGSFSLLVVLLFLCVWRRKLLFGIVASMLFLLLGMWGYAWERDETGYEWSSEEQLYEARVMEVPRARERSMLCEMEVKAICDSSVWNEVGYRVFAYMEPCDDAATLSPGDILCFKGIVRAPQNFSDSLTFDYARYVIMQGVAGTIYLPHNRWVKVGEGRKSLRERMLCLQQRLSSEYMAETFSGDVLGVLSALTLGDKRGLSAELRAVYNDAGTAHVLALSGMHVGLIYGVIVFLLHALLSRRSLRWIRELLAISVLWTFALLVGMPASVVRAVVLCSLYIFARWVSDGTSSSLHILSLTALLMLLVCPFYLFDVGFQLSFMAMVAILWVEPYMEQFFCRYSLHPILGYFVGVVCMSLAAQLGTSPLVLYHFGIFPTYFLLTNLVVVPCLAVVLLLSLVWWSSLLLGIPWVGTLSVLLQRIVEWMNQFLVCIGQWPGAVLHIDNFGAPAVLCTYLFIFFAGLFIIKKWPRAAVFALAALLGLVVCLVFSV